MKLYFKNIDGLRLIAALLVVYHHCILFANDKYPSLYLIGRDIASHWGTLGVNIFFVLSSFLITSLLLQEIENTDNLNFKKFYIRRALRIWPLYFMFGVAATCLSAVLFNAIGYNESAGQIGSNLAYLFSFAINFQIMHSYNRDIIEIFWSVCIEEHFYLVWPLLVWLFRKKIVLLCTLTLLVSIMSYVFFYFNDLGFRYPQYYFTLCRFDLFALGGALAYYTKKRKIQFSNMAGAGSIAASLFLIFTNYTFALSNYTLFTSLVSGVVFSLLIAYLINCKSSILESKIMKEGGKISYGIYVLHPFMVHVSLYICAKYCSNQYLFCLIYPLLSVATTWLVASISYYIIEERFIKMKSKYTIIHKIQ